MVRGRRTAVRGRKGRNYLPYIFLIFLLIIGVVFVQRYAIGPNLSLLSVSQVTIQPTGSADSTGRWTGSFWIVTGTVDASESSVFYQLDPSASGTVNNQVINPKATVKITFTPMQPYYQRALVYHTIQVISEVHPAAYWYEGGYYDYDGNYVPGWEGWIEKQYDIVPQLSLSYYTFATSIWEQHTPFQVTVTKIKADGSTDFTATKTIDTLGGVNNVVITNPNDASQQIVISDLGKIGTGYSQPTFSDNMILLDASHNVIDKDNNLMNIIGYDRSDSSYSVHFYGDREWRWSDGTPKPPTPDMWWSIFNLGPDYNYPKNYPGWGVKYTDYSTGGLTYWTYDYSVNPASIDDLKNYLRSLNYVVDTDLNAQTWGQGVSIDNNMLRVNMPGGSASSLITMKISTEMADSYVYKPSYGTFTISDASWSSGSSELKYNVASQLNVKVKCTSPGTFNLEASSSTTDLSITPAAISDTLATGDEKTYSFNVKNTGVSTTTTGIVSLALKDSSGTVDDSKTLSFTLDPIYYTVTILVKDSSGSAISMASVTFNGVTQTTDSGGSISFSGIPKGSYNYVVSKTGYNDASGSVTVNSADVTTTVVLTAKTAPPPSTFTVTISVKDSQGSSIPSATVVLSGTSKSTDSSGNAAFSGMASGTYSFTVTRGGYSDVSDSVIVTSSDLTKSVIMTQVDPTGDFYINGEKVTSSSIIKVTSPTLSLKVTLTSQQSIVSDVEVMIVQGSTTLKSIKNSAGGFSVSGNDYSASYTLPSAGSYAVTAKISTSSKTITLSVIGLSFSAGAIPVDLGNPYVLVGLVAVLAVLMVVALKLKPGRQRRRR